MTRRSRAASARRRGDQLASFRVSAWAISSVAFDVLGYIAGYNRHEALGRWARAGSECMGRQSHVLSDAFVRAIFGPQGMEALLAAKLAEQAEGGLRMLEMGRAD